MVHHKKIKEQHWEEPWPRKQILPHTECKCPYCKKYCKNIELHINAQHKFEKKKLIKGVIHGHD